MNHVQKTICGTLSGLNDLRQTPRSVVVPALKRPVAMLFQRSAALALHHSDALLLQRFVARTLWCSSSPVLHCSNTPALRSSRVLLSQRSTARVLSVPGNQMLWHSNAVLQHTAAPVPCCLSAPLLRLSTDQLLWDSNAQALRGSAAAALPCTDIPCSGTLLLRSR